MRPASPFLTDTHAHLADPQLLADVDDIVARAGDAGVERILAVGTNLDSSRTCVDLADRFASVFAAVGIHPQESLGFESTHIDQIRALAAHSKVVAIGETGLDYVRDAIPSATQRLAFGAQVSLAAELGLPVVIHNRGADDDVLAVLSTVDRSANPTSRAGVLHCFTGGTEFARRAHALGFLISFAGNLTYRRSEALRAVANELPLEWLLTETDSPYLSPEPRRGKTNNPSNVRYIVNTLADVRGLPVDAVAASVRDNAHHLFAWPLS